MSQFATGSRPVPPWLITHSYTDRDAGVLKSGKEAEVFLVERESADGSCLLAHKRYRPRYPRKGQLRAEGFAGQLLLMLSSGGTCTVETACEVPIRLVESGPAGGAAAARAGSSA